MSAWITTYGYSLGFSHRGSGLILSSFWVSLIIARLIASTIVTPEEGVEAIAVFGILAFIIIWLLSLTKSKTAAIALIFPSGLGLGPVFPTIVGVALFKTDPALHGSAFAIISAIGLLDASIIPAATGVYSKARNIQKALRIAMAAAFVLFIIALLMARV